MAASSREQPRNWIWWLVGGLVAALLVIGAYTFATRAQRPDLPPASLSVQLPTPSSVPGAPNLPPPPVPAPR